MRFAPVYILILLTVISCSRGESRLTRALSGAVKEKKVTQSKMESILKEYDKLSDEDKSTAREYVDLILSAIEMGGDSTHIDAARKHVLRKKQEKHDKQDKTV